MTGTGKSSLVRRLLELLDLKGKSMIFDCGQEDNDSGVDISRFDEYLDEFDEIIGLDRIQVVHINDSKNPLGSKKDRHELIGYGTIGFDALINVIYNPRLDNIPFILETPRIGNSEDDKARIYPPYKFEVEEIIKKKFNENIKQEVRDFYS